MLKKFIDHHRQNSFAWLFISFVLTIGLQPVLQIFGIEILGAFLAFNLIALVLTSHGSIGPRLIILLALLFLGLRTFHHFSANSTLLIAGEAIWILCCMLAALSIVQKVFRKGPVNSQRIFAALDLYLLISIVFAIAYRVLDQLMPGSFNISSANLLSFQEALYFSIITLTTLGYGDIFPVTDAARGVAALEAISGQIYMAVLVARLVSLYARHEEK